MKGFIGTVGKVAAGALQATREEDGSREKLEGVIEDHNETIKSLGEICLDK